MLSIIQVSHLDLAPVDELKLLHQRLNPSVFQRLDFDGREIKWGPLPSDTSAFSHRGLMFIHFWAIECKPCIDELPEIKKLMLTLKSRNVYPVYITESDNRDSVAAFYRKNANLFSTEAEHYYSISSVTRDFWGVSAQPLSVLTDGRSVIHRAFVGSLKWRQSQVKDAVDLFLGAMKPSSAAPSCPPPKLCPVTAPPKACLVSVPPVTERGTKLGPDWSQLLQGLQQHGVALTEIQEALKRLEAFPRVESAQRDPDAGLAEELRQMRGQIERSQKEMTTVSSQLAADRHASWWYRLGGVGGLLASIGVAVQLWWWRRRFVLTGKG